jgi:lipopolysaccharide exporter
MGNNKSISNAVAGGVAWMLVLRMSLRGLGLVSTVILARLLTPEDFGLVAIAMSLFAFLHLIKDFGFDTAIIQISNPSRSHYDTAWTFNLIFGIFLAVVLALSSGWISTLYGSPKLQPLLWAIAGLFIIGGLENVGTLDFRKNLTFNKEFKLKILPKLIGVPCTLMLAYWLRSYWALTIGTIVTQLAGLCAGYLMHNFRPKLGLSAAKELFNFSKWLMANNLIYFINNRSPELFIGKILNPQAAGLFSVANEVATMPTSELSSAVSRASYPGYAKVSNELGELKNLFLNVLSSAALLLIPIAIGVAVTADLLVPVFLGEQWLTVIPVIKVISIAGLLIALNSNAGYVFMAIGKPQISTILGAVRVILFLPLLIYLVNEKGLVGAAWAMLGAASVMFFVTNIVVVFKLPVGLKDLIRVFYRPALASIVMLICVYPFAQIEGNASLLEQALRLAGVAISGAIIYFLIVYFLWLLSGKPMGPESKLYSLGIRKLSVMNRTKGPDD